jgi:hypothetical protein
LNNFITKVLWKNMHLCNMIAGKAWT